MVKECINNYMSKDETQRYLQSRYLFARQDINEALWNSPNVQRYAAQVPQEAANNAKALENQNLQASPAYPNDFWQQLLNTLDQIQSKTRHLNALREIKISTDQTVELLTDGHGFGPHPSAAGSSKRQRLGEAEERGGDGETEKLQKKEEGNIKEAEKNERGDSMKK
ncbi:unnamed protein product [Brassica rapa subsp. trilocularis]